VPIQFVGAKPDASMDVEDLQDFLKGVEHKKRYVVAVPEEDWDMWRRGIKGFDFVALLLFYDENGDVVKIAEYDPVSGPMYPTQVMSD